MEALLHALEEAMKKNHIKKISLVTTNDNPNAMRFYQKRGYGLMAILIDAVNKARTRKPSIPFVAENGIPITDEIVIEKFI